MYHKNIVTREIYKKKVLPFTDTPKPGLHCLYFLQSEQYGLSYPKRQNLPGLQIHLDGVVEEQFCAYCKPFSSWRQKSILCSHPLLVGIKQNNNWTNMSVITWRCTVHPLTFFAFLTAITVWIEVKVLSILIRRTWCTHSIGSFSATCVPSIACNYIILVT